MLAAALGFGSGGAERHPRCHCRTGVGAAFLIAIMRPRITRAHVAIAGLAITAMASFYISPAGQKLRSRTRWFIEDPRGGARLLLWRDSLRMAAARPLVGWGPETFTTEFPRIESKELARAYPDFHYESPHNILIDSFVSAGIVGLAGMIAVLGIGFYAAFIAGKESSVEGAVLAGALAASLVAQQFTVFIIPTALYFYMTIAILVALAVRHPIEIRRRFWPLRCRHFRRLCPGVLCDCVNRSGPSARSSQQCARPRRPGWSYGILQALARMAAARVDIRPLVFTFLGSVRATIGLGHTATASAGGRVCRSREREPKCGRPSQRLLQSGNLLRFARRLCRSRSKSQTSYPMGAELVQTALDTGAGASTRGSVRGCRRQRRRLPRTSMGVRMRKLGKRSFGSSRAAAV